MSVSTYYSNLCRKGVLNKDDVTFEYTHQRDEWTCRLYERGNLRYITVSSTKRNARMQALEIYLTQLGFRLERAEPNFLVLLNNLRTQGVIEEELSYTYTKHPHVPDQWECNMYVDGEETFTTYANSKRKARYEAVAVFLTAGYREEVERAWATEAFYYY